MLGGDLQGLPNGRRLEDDVIDIAERAVAGALIGKKRAARGRRRRERPAEPAAFPYEPDPRAGFDNTKGVAFPKTG